MAKGSRLLAALLMALLAAGCSGGGLQTTPPVPAGPAAPMAAPPSAAATPAAEVDLPSQPLAVFAHEVMGLRYRRQPLGGKVAVGVVLPPSDRHPALLQYGLVSAEKHVKQGNGEVVLDLWWKDVMNSIRVSREDWTLGPSHGQWRVEGVASSDTCDLRVVGDALTLRKGEHAEQVVRLADLPHMASPNGSDGRAAQFAVAHDQFAAYWPAADCTAAAFVTRGAGQPLLAWVTKLDERWTVTPLDLYFEGGGLAVLVSPDGRYAGVLAALPSGAYTIALYGRDRVRLPLGGLPKTANAPGMMQPPTDLHWEGEVLTFTFGGQVYQVVPGNPATVQAVH